MWKPRLSDPEAVLGEGGGWGGAAPPPLVLRREVLVGRVRSAFPPPPIGELVDGAVMVPSAAHSGGGGEANVTRSKSSPKISVATDAILTSDRS